MLCSHQLEKKNIQSKKIPTLFSHMVFSLVLEKPYILSEGIDVGYLKV